MRSAGGIPGQLFAHTTEASAVSDQASNLLARRISQVEVESDALNVVKTIDAKDRDLSQLSSYF